MFSSGDEGCTSQGGCHGDASCIRGLTGSYFCQCNFGFVGDGHNCTSKSSFSDCISLQFIVGLGYMPFPTFRHTLYVFLEGTP